MKGALTRAAQKNDGPYREAAQPPRPSLEDVLADAREFVSDACWDAFSQKVSKRYNQ